MAAADLVKRIVDPVGRPPADSGMIRIPGGTFRMGLDRHHPGEAPVHRIAVDDGFRIDRTPVTNRIARVPGRGTSIGTRPSG